MIVDDSIEFRFQTRTLSEDYRVFADGGEQTLNYAEEFEPLERVAGVESDDERSAVVFEDDGSVYVSAFGLKRNAFDRARREIRFSFCLILPSSEKRAAMRAFSRLVKEWDETGEEVSKLIREIPVPRKDWKGRDTHGEDVRFSYQAFYDNWLVEKSENYALPKAGTMLKWVVGTGEPVPQRIRKSTRKEEEELPGLYRKSYPLQTQKQKSSSRVWLAVLSILLILSCVMGGVCYKKLLDTRKSISKMQQSETAELKRRLESADKEISGLTERVSTVQASLIIEKKEAENWKSKSEKLKAEVEDLKAKVKKLQSPRGTVTPTKR